MTLCQWLPSLGSSTLSNHVLIVYHYQHTSFRVFSDVVHHIEEIVYHTTIVSLQLFLLVLAAGVPEAEERKMRP